MGIIRISENVYSMGVLNPSLRVFDIIMKAEYGTSYNSYLITGSKNIIIDTVHNDFFDEYIYNLQCMIDIKDIGYIVINHTELDHSGSLSKLLKMNPDINVICTVAAKKYLSQIVNSEFNCIIVKDGDTLELGDKKLKFIVAPFLHWPDSMMTYYEEEEVLFTCDMLGCHFCEPSGMDSSIYYKKEYFEQFKYYYHCIFGPFKSYVVSGLDKIKGLKMAAVCPSHGPVLIDNIRECINSYYEWSKTEKSEEKYIAVVYASCYGCTKKLALEAQTSISSEMGIQIKLVDAVSVPINEITSIISNAAGLMIGSCTINRDAPKIIWDILSRIDAINTRKKPAGCFGSYGWSGEAVDMVKDRLSGLGYKFIGDGLKVNFVPVDKDFSAMKDYALQVASGIK